MTTDQQKEAAAKRAMDAAPPVRKVYGKIIDVDLEDVGFDDVARRYTTFNPSVHGHQKPRTRIVIEIEVFKRAGTYVAKKEMIDSSKDWQDITRPSMIKTGLGLTTMEGKWVGAEQRRTGRTWNDKTTGEPKYAEALYFTEVFKDQAECEGAYAEQFYGSEPVDESEKVDNNQPTNDGAAYERGAMTLWNVVSQNEQQFMTTVSANPMIMGHFGTADVALEFVRQATKNVPQQVEADPIQDVADSNSDEDIPF